MPRSGLLWLVLQLCLCTTVGAQNPPAEERDVLATVQRLFDAMRTRDTATLRSLFVRDARLFGVRTGQTGEVVLQSPERGWQIVSIADTFETQGCPSRPPPNP
jgi:putative lumazine-binding protein